MESQVYECPTCSQPIAFENVDFKTRRAHCEWCENDVILPRQEITGSDKVLNELKQAVRFFVEKDFKMAEKYAIEVLSTAVNHAAGLFIHGYYRAFVDGIKNRDTLNKFFNEDLQTIQDEGGMTDEELEGFKQCVLSVVPNVAEYEQPILAAVLANDPDGVVAFTEAFAPASIMKRTDIDWVNDEIFNIYKEIGSRGPIPKTWFALFSGMVQNPWSPYKAGFHLKTRTQKFFDTYVTRVEKLLSSISNETLRTKFYGAFTNKKQEFISKMN
ncbi:MAG: hypothetical protein IJ308_04085 [Clostridia bacterium]|nr:hypothetical protein [Clostridia bacterium]